MAMVRMDRELWRVHTLARLTSPVGGDEPIKPDAFVSDEVMEELAWRQSEADMTAYVESHNGG